MSDERPTHPTDKPDSYERGEPRKATRNIPPLIWVILAILVLVVAVFWMQRGGTHVTPQGGTAPQADQGATYMPPAAATGDAPATPGSTTVETK